jgi:uncharacterized protein DUF3352
VRATRALTALLLSFLTLLAAGCGGGGGGAGVSTESAAGLIRAGALAFISFDSDLGSSQWQQVDELSKKFPGRAEALAEIKKSLAEEGVDWERDVKPALGPEVDLVIVSEGTSESTRVVGFTKPTNADKFKAMVAKLNEGESSGDRAVYREVNGWYAISDSQAAIDQVLKGDGDALADDGMFNEALETLPEDALVKVFLDGGRLNELVRDYAAQSGSSFDLSSVGLDKLEYVSASTSAESDGLRLRGATKGADFGGGDFSSKLFGGVPGDAFTFFTFRGRETTEQLEKLKSNAQVAEALQQLQSALGVTFEEVLALLRNEVAFYVRPGAIIPELTLVLETQDQTSALATLDKLAARVAAYAGTQVQPGAQGSHSVKTINFGSYAVHYGGLGDKVIVTSGASGIADYGASGERLPDNADFNQAQEAAGMPDTTGGFIYVDLKDTIPLIESFASLAGQEVPSEVTENLRPLRSFLAWTEGSGGSRSFDAFLEIK